MPSALASLGAMCCPRNHTLGLSQGAQPPIYVHCSPTVRPLGYGRRGSDTGFCPGCGETVVDALELFAGGVLVSGDRDIVGAAVEVLALTDAAVSREGPFEFC